MDASQENDEANNPTTTANEEPIDEARGEEDMGDDYGNGDLANVTDWTFTYR
jgi:hypothetical protein